MKQADTQEIDFSPFQRVFTFVDWKTIKAHYGDVPITDSLIYDYIMTTLKEGNEHETETIEYEIDY